MLETCDAHAKPVGDYDKAVQSAVDGLIALGVFTEAEFADVKIGFCDLRSAGGPVATASCSESTILIDRKYAAASERLVLISTLAHEMAHQLQFQSRKFLSGESYCFSEAYGAEKQQMEAEAAALGDAVVALAFVGRPIEIDNACPSAIEVYLDGEHVSFDSANPPKVVTVPANSTVSAGASSTSKFVNVYAASNHADGRRWAWGDMGSGGERIINGERRRLTRHALVNRERASGPFVLELNCD